MYIYIYINVYIYIHMLIYIYIYWFQQSSSVLCSFHPIFGRLICFIQGESPPWCLLLYTPINGNVSTAIVNHPFLMVYTTHLWWVGGWFILLYQHELYPPNQPNGSQSSASHLTGYGITLPIHWRHQDILCVSSRILEMQSMRTIRKDHVPKS